MSEMRHYIYVLCLSVSLYRHIFSLFLYVCLCLSFTVCLSMHVFLCLSIPLSLYLCLSDFLNVVLTVNLCLYVCLSERLSFVCPCMSVSLSVYPLTVCRSVYLLLCKTVSLNVCISECLAL